MIPYPQWPEFVDDESSLRRSYDADPEFARVKRRIVETYGEENLARSWISTCTELERVTEEIKIRDTNLIPDIRFEDIQNGSLSADQVDEIKRIGCFIVRGVISPSEAAGHLKDLKDYVTSNKGRYTGFPKDQPSMYDLFNTPTQNTLRTHPSLLEVMQWCNTLWEYPSDEKDASPDRLIYADGFRIRQPGTTFLGLGPHIDAGGLARWGSPTYEKVYESIFSGHPERFNPYDISMRKDADQAFYGGRHPSTVLRAFQGWTALSRNAPREGNILVYPMVKHVLPYVLLRPFFRPPQDTISLLDPSTWTFDPHSPWFPGTSKQLGQLLSPASHPHLHLQECLLRVPAINAGDTFWWHSDMCHAVDPEHIGSEVASVVYLAAVPTTETNLAYAQDQYSRMVRGLPPRDFAYGIDESQLEGFKGFSDLEDLYKSLMGGTHNEDMAAA